MVNNIFHDYLQAMTIEIKTTNKCNNLNIIQLKQHVQTIVSQVQYLYIRCLEYRLILKTIFIIYDFSTL